MTALLAVEADPGLDLSAAANALRQPALTVRWLEVSRRVVVATVEVADAAALALAVAAVEVRPGLHVVESVSVGA